jgi:hypothetical protein
MVQGGDAEGSDESDAEDVTGDATETPQEVVDE